MAAFRRPKIKTFNVEIRRFGSCVRRSARGVSASANPFIVTASADTLSRLSIDADVIDQNQSNVLLIEHRSVDLRG